MSLAATFESLRDALQRHLPRAADGSLVSLGSDGLQVHEPGVRVGDLALLLQDLTGSGDLLPDGLPVADLRLASLTLARSGRAVTLEFAVTWDGASLALGPGCTVAFERFDFRLRRGVIEARAAARLTVEGHGFDVALTLPNRLLSLDLDAAALATGAAGALSLLADRGLVPSLGGPTLRALSLRGSLWLQRLQCHVELENLFQLGALNLAWARADVLLAGGGAATASAAARMTLTVSKGRVLTIEAEGEVDARGWRLAGELVAPPKTLTLAALAAALSGSAAPPSLPGLLRDCALRRLALAVDSHDGSAVAEVELVWPHDAVVSVRLACQGGLVQASGRLSCAGVDFELAFTGGAQTALMGSYAAAGSRGLTLDAVLTAMSVPSATSLDVVIDVKAAALVLDGKGRPLMAAQVDAGIDLTRLGQLPLVGALLPHAEPLGLSFSPSFMATGFDTQALASLPPLPSALVLPTPPAAGLTLTATLHLGDGQPTTLPVFQAGDGPAEVKPPSVTATAAPAVLGAPGTADALTWKVVDKSLGPLRIGRIGHALATAPKGVKRLELALDASLSFAGVTLSVDGLGASYEFATHTLTPHLQGLGIDLRRGEFTVGGAFLHADGEFLGRVRIGTPKFALNAFGAFMMVGGTPSMYAYAVLDMPLGGPVFFFVEGLAAGFGLHRRLHMPPIEGLRQFPLIAAAGSAPSPTVKPGEELRKLHEQITPALGEHFLAVGLKFNSFRLLHGQALLVVSVGENFEVDLLGTADFVSPPDLPPTAPALARIRLDLLARWAPAEGLIAVEARVDPASYVYGPLCHLSGGFAFYAWTDGLHAGDFVLSVGGYHPQYLPNKPAHYPSVPRVELSYQITPEVYLKGDAYFALTPSVMMAGGGLHAQVEIGSLHAWADFTADFWVAWAPFHYDAALHIDIGARWKCFSTSASADLHLWGPDFSGNAHVQWCVFSFDVSFGPQSPVLPLPISVPTFCQRFLGVDASHSADDTLGIVVAGGGIGQVDAGGKAPAPPLTVVTPAELLVTTSSKVPAHSARLGSQVIDVGQPAIGMPPTWLTRVDASEHLVTVVQVDAAGGEVPVDTLFTATRLDTLFPTALWGTSYPVDPASKPFKAASGLALRPAQPVQAGAGQDIAVSALQYADTVWASAQGWSAFQRNQPVTPPTVLPVSELAALGLDATGWRPAASPAGRPRIDLLVGAMETVHG